MSYVLVSSVTENTALALWVPLSESGVISGVRWYNNDGNTVFPEVLAIAGDEVHPELLSEAVVVATGVSGLALSWNDLLFDTPISSVSSGLYLIFRFPEGEAFVSEGSNGGAGLGYIVGDGVPRCWLTGDGESWSPINPDYQIAVRAVMSENKSSNVLVIGGPDAIAGRADDAKKSAQNFVGLMAVPNPFNPQTEFRFSLPTEGIVSLKVFDIRGRSIRTLLSESLSEGPHRVQWNGCDDSGRALASGVYFAQLRAGKFRQSMRVTLVR